MNGRSRWLESRAWFIVVLSLCAVGVFAFWGPYTIIRFSRSFPRRVGYDLIPVAALLLPTTLAALYFRMNVRRGVLPRNTRLSGRRIPSGAALGLIVGVALGLAPYVAWVLIGRGYVAEQHLVLLLQWWFVPFALRVLAFAAAEELAFRGLLLESIERRWGSLSAVVISSLLFGMYHVLLGPRAMVNIAIDGLTFALLILATRSLWAAVTCHWALNLVFMGAFGARLLVFRGYGPPMGSFDWQEVSILVALVLLVIAWRRRVIVFPREIRLRGPSLIPVPSNSGNERELSSEIARLLPARTVAVVPEHPAWNVRDNDEFGAQLAAQVVLRPE